MMFAENVFGETRLLLSTSPPSGGDGKWAVSSLMARIWSVCINAAEHVLYLIGKGVEVRALTRHCYESRVSGPWVTQLPSGVGHEFPGLGLGTLAGTRKPRRWVRRGRLGSRTDVNEKYWAKWEFNILGESQIPQTQKMHVLWSCCWVTAWKSGKSTRLEWREPESGTGSVRIPVGP